MTMEHRAELAAGAVRLGVTLPETALDQFQIYLDMLLDWNTRVNLTAITEPAAVVRKHFLDSLSLVPHVPAAAHRCLDVGTGAGFPGVPLAIVRTDLAWTLLDSLQKRLRFLEALGEALAIPFTCVHARAEEGARTALREQFDLVTARAVAALPVLCEYCLPYLRVGGRFIAMKGPACEAEAAASRDSIRRLGGRLTELALLTLPGEGEAERRTLVLIDKVAPTPMAFPRPSAKIAKQPL